MEKLVFNALLLLIPLNLARHFFFEFSYVRGILVDYLAPTVYATDILAWLLICFWLVGVLKAGGLRLKIGKSAAVCRPLLIFALIAGLSLFAASSFWGGFYRWLRLVEYTLFALYVAFNVNRQSRFPRIVWLLTLAAVFESALAVLQWFHQGSLFGYWFLGELPFRVYTPGIATVVWRGQLRVLPYGTFPHPNVLGGYLAIILPWMAANFRSRGPRGKPAIWFLKSLGPVLLGLVALFFTFSQAAWAAGLLGMLAVSGARRKFGGLARLGAVGFFPLASLSVVRRVELVRMAGKMLGDHPFLGVGLGNFVVRMGEYGRISGYQAFLQPVHNIFLLVAAETGLFGLLAFLFLLFAAYCSLIGGMRSRDPTAPRLLISLTQILFLGLFDHYFWDIHQTALFFWLTIGLALGYNRR